VLVARTGVPLADVYLEFLGGRCRPNTVRAAAYNLKVFFAAVGKPRIRSGLLTLCRSSLRSGPARLASAARRSR
jgi:hypothetical protein